MPLSKGYSKRTVSKNIAKMMGEGKPKKQAIAASLDTARRSAKKAGKPEKGPKPNPSSTRRKSVKRRKPGRKRASRA